MFTVDCSAVSPTRFRMIWGLPILYISAHYTERRALLLTTALSVEVAIGAEKLSRRYDGVPQPTREHG
jgi:hypothetical protein